MTKLEKLIGDLCPNGVEYRTLNTICNVYDGTHQTPQYTDTGIKFASVENITNPYATEKYISVVDYEKYKIKPQRNDLLMTRIGSIGVCTVIESDEPLAYYVSLALLRPNNEVLNSRYLKYAIESLHCRKELRKRTLVNAVPTKINMGDIGKITLPVPPLPVQQEIIRILDNFTELTEELTEKLTAELTARKKQYEYYRDKLLTFGDDVPKIKLCDLFDTRNGYTPSKANKDFWASDELPWFRMEDIRENGRILNDAIQHISLTAAKGKPFPSNSIIVSTSATIGEHALITCEALANQRFTCLSLKNRYKKDYDIMFLFYYCFKLDEYCCNCLNQGNFASVDMGKFSKFEFPLIPIAEQYRIVELLNRFDTLCNDLSSGLPAEINARQKQYEYYRDKLLTFKEKTS